MDDLLKIPRFLQGITTQEITCRVCGETMSMAPGDDYKCRRNDCPNPSVCEAKPEGNRE